MKTSRAIIYCLISLNIVDPSLAFSTEGSLTLKIPECRSPKTRPLPTKYYAYNGKKIKFNWAKKVTHGDFLFGGRGDLRIDGSTMYEWFEGQRLDLNSDRICDISIIGIAPLSTGGDSMILNTFYLGSQPRWIRHGAKLGRSCDVDIIGCESGDHPKDYIISSDPFGMIYDKAEGITYFIGALRYRTDADDAKRGYRVLRWNQKKNHFDELNKWDENSPAWKVYAFFKANGASETPGGDVKAPIVFDPDVERTEIDLVCDRYFSSSSVAVANKRAHIKCSPK